MNKDILKGKWLEIKGSIKEKWGKLTDNELGEIEGKGEKLLGLLRKKHGYIKDKAELEYKDSVELAEIVSGIIGIMAKNKGFMPLAFIGRYGWPLLAEKQESRITGEEVKHGDDTDRYLDSRLSRRTHKQSFHHKLTERSNRYEEEKYHYPLFIGSYADRHLYSLRSDTHT